MTRPSTRRAKKTSIVVKQESHKRMRVDAVVGQQQKKEDNSYPILETVKSSEIENVTDIVDPSPEHMDTDIMDTEFMDTSPLDINSSVANLGDQISERRPVPVNPYKIQKEYSDDAQRFGYNVPRILEAKLEQDCQHCRGCIKIGDVIAESEDGWVHYPKCFDLLGGDCEADTDDEFGDNMDGVIFTDANLSPFAKDITHS